MSDTTFTVNVDIAAIETAYDEGNIKRAQTLLAQRVGTDSNRYCKWDTGATWESMTGSSDFESGTVCWSTPYAGEAYYNPSVGTHPTVPNGKTEPHAQWFEVAKGRHSAEWTRLVKELLEA